MDFPYPEPASGMKGYERMDDIDSQINQAKLSQAEEGRQAAVAVRLAAEVALRRAKEEETQAREAAAMERLVKQAQNRQLIAEAEQKAAEAQQKQLAALIPDLSKVTGGALEISNDTPAVAARSLTFGALSRAAEAIANRIHFQANWRVLVTSDTDLAALDFQRCEVVAGMEQLIEAVDALLPVTTVEGIDDIGGIDEELAAADAEDGDQSAGDQVKKSPRFGFARDTSDWSAVGITSGRMVAGAAQIAAGAMLGGPPGAGVAALGAVMSVVPQILSFFSVQRTLTTKEITVTDLAAAAAVAGALERKGSSGIVVVKDDFRLTVTGPVQECRQTLARKRHDLLARKIALSDRKSAVDSALAVATADERALADADTRSPSHEKDLRDALVLVAVLTQKATRAAIRLSLVETLLTSVDTFLTAIHKAPEGSGRSPIAAAALAEQLHSGAPASVPMLKDAPTNGELYDGKPNEPSPDAPYFTHVMLVKAETGQTLQLFEDRAGPLKDEFLTIVEANITYMLMSTTDSSVVSSGTLSATQALHGELGKDPTIRPVEVGSGVHYA